MPIIVLHTKNRNVKNPFRLPVYPAEISIALQDETPRRYSDTVYGAPQETAMNVGKTYEWKTLRHFSEGMKHMRNNFQDIRPRHSIRGLSDSSVPVHLIPRVVKFKSEVVIRYMRTLWVKPDIEESWKSYNYFSICTSDYPTNRLTNPNPCL